jgi:hypothetical protein
MQFKPPSSSLLAACLLAVLMSSGCATRNYTDLYGQAAPVTGANRTIVISPDTRYVNVEGGEVIRFVVGGKEFGWDFYVARTVHTFDLKEVAPVGLLDHSVRVYLTPDPRYVGGDADM